MQYNSAQPVGAWMDHCQEGGPHHEESGPRLVFLHPDCGQPRAPACQQAGARLLRGGGDPVSFEVQEGDVVAVQPP